MMLKLLTRYCSGLWSRLTPAPPHTVPNMPVQPQPYSPTRIITTIGTVVFDKKAHFYGIRTDGGTQYLPFNLNDYPDCLKNGLRVHFTAVLYPDVTTIHKWGTTIKLLSLHQAPT